MHNSKATNTSDLTATVVGIIIAIILLGGVLIPFINTTTTVEKSNENYAFRATGDYGEYEYEWDSTSKDLMLNGEVVYYNPDQTAYQAIGVHTANVGMTNIYQSAGIWFEAEGLGIQNGSTKVTFTSDGSWTAIKNDTVSTSTVPATGQAFFANNDGEYAVYYSVGTVQNTIHVEQGKPVYLFCNYGQYLDNSVTYGIIYYAELIDGELTNKFVKSIDSSGVVTDITDSANINVAYTDMTTENGVTTYTNLYSNVTYGSTTMQVRNLHAVELNYTEQESGVTATILMIIPVFIALGIIMYIGRMFITKQ